MMSQLSSQRYPFVLKNQQSFGGGGTFVVNSEEELLELQHSLSTRMLPKLLSQVNPSNAHLKPATLTVSELVVDPIGNWCLMFFVTRTGDCIYLAAAQQIVDSAKAWMGSTICYTAQDSLKERFTPIMQQIGAWLAGYGYYGPCGADILETAPQHSDSCGAPDLNIVDLNVRTASSLASGLLKGHFSERRGLHEASTFGFAVRMTRDAFIRHFESRFREGRMVIISWHEDRASGDSLGKLVVAAETRAALAEEVAKVKEITCEILI